MANWHWMKRVWIDRMLDPCYDFQLTPHPWPWPWIFKVKFWKSRISGMGWLIHMERKGCESIGCYTHFVTFNFDLNHDLDLGFSRKNMEIAVTQQWEVWLTWNERGVSWIDVGCRIGLTLGHGAWQIDRPSNGSMWNSYSFQPVGQWMGYSFTDLGAEGCCRSLNALLCLE